MSKQFLDRFQSTSFSYLLSFDIEFNVRYFVIVET